MLSSVGVMLISILVLLYYVSVSVVRVNNVEGIVTAGFLAITLSTKYNRRNYILCGATILCFIIRYSIAVLLYSFRFSIAAVSNSMAVMLAVINLCISIILVINIKVNMQYKIFMDFDKDYNIHNNIAKNFEYTMIATTLFSLVSLYSVFIAYRSVGYPSVVATCSYVIIISSLLILLYGDKAFTTWKAVYEKDKYQIEQQELQQKEATGEQRG